MIKIRRIYDFYNRSSLLDAAIWLEGGCVR